MPARGPSANEIADELRDRIHRGDLAPGDRLPTSRQLVDDYGSSLQTVTRAIAQLRHEGLVVTRERSGAYVRERLPILRLARNRLARSERDASRGFFLTDADLGGWQARSEVTVRVEPATASVANVLDIEEGSPVLVRDRQMYADDQPVQLAVSYLPRDITEGTAIEQDSPGAGGITGRLDDAGHRVTHWRETVTTSPATDTEAELLALPAESLCWRILRVAYSETRPVEANYITASTDRVELVYEIAAD